MTIGEGKDFKKSNKSAYLIDRYFFKIMGALLNK